MASPENVLSSDKKYYIFLFQLVFSIAIAVIVIVELYNRKYFNENNSAAYTMVGCLIYIIVLLCTGFVVDFVLKIINPGIKIMDVLIKEPQIIFPDESMLSEELFNETEFWSIINSSGKKIDPSQTDEQFSEIINSLSNYHPAKIIEFRNRLNDVRKSLITETIYDLYLFIWKRKYEGDYFEHFIDFIIIQGKPAVNNILMNPEYFADFNFDLNGLIEFSINEPLAMVFSSKTGKVFPNGFVNEENSFVFKNNINSAEIKMRYPKVYKMYN